MSVPWPGQEHLRHRLFLAVQHGYSGNLSVSVPPVARPLMETPFQGAAVAGVSPSHPALAQLETLLLLLTPGGIRVSRRVYDIHTMGDTNHCTLASQSWFNHSLVVSPLR